MNDLLGQVKHMVSGTSAAATLQHIELLASKRARLAQAQIDAEEAFLMAIRRDHLGDDAALLEVYAEYRAVALPGYTQRWSAVLGSHQSIASRSAQRAANMPNHEDGKSWRGAAPLDYREPAPRKGQSVVYVLYDADSRPCYVGSSGCFRDRLKQHIKAGKPVAHWTAFPCDDRQAAYDLEDRLLRQHKPYLNRRARR